jgi:hypothetical protein
MTGLPYDPSDPPIVPPANCRHELMWRLARAVWQEHQAGLDGFCLAMTCRRKHSFHPCPNSRLAADGLRAACQQQRDRRAGSDLDDQQSMGE